MAERLNLLVEKDLLAYRRSLDMPKRPRKTILSSPLIAAPVVGFAMGVFATLAVKNPEPFVSDFTDIFTWTIPKESDINAPVIVEKKIPPTECTVQELRLKTPVIDPLSPAEEAFGETPNYQKAFSNFEKALKVFESDPSLEIDLKNAIPLIWSEYEPEQDWFARIRVETKEDQKKFMVAVNSAMFEQDLNADQEEQARQQLKESILVYQECKSDTGIPTQ